MTRFTAGTQYGDWKGTAAADEFGTGSSFDELFEATGKVNKENELLIGFEFYIGENSFFYLAGYFHPKSNSNPHGWIPSLNDDFKKITKPIPVRKIEVELTLEQFLKYFKRLNVILIKHGLDISGREYEEISEA